MHEIEHDEGGFDDRNCQSDDDQAGYKQRDTEDEADARSFAKSEANHQKTSLHHGRPEIAYGLRVLFWPR